MAKQLKILIVEDDPSDLELLHNELKKSEINYVSENVKTKKDFII